MKVNRGLSGIYYRTKIDGKWKNRTFEDLPLAEQENILDKADPEFLKNMIKMLSNTLNFIGNKFDISTNEEEEI